MIFYRVLLGLLLFIISVLVHELTHIIVIRRFNRHARVILLYKDFQKEFFGLKRYFDGFEVVGDFLDLDNVSLIKVYSYAIFTGLLVIFFSSIFIDPRYYLIIIVYVLVCRDDVNNIFRIMRRSLPGGSED